MYIVYKCFFRNVSILTIFSNSFKTSNDDHLTCLKTAEAFKYPGLNKIHQADTDCNKT